MELDAWLSHGLRLKQQPLAVGLDTVLQLVVPSDVDAVCDLYISRGALELCFWLTLFQREYVFCKTSTDAIPRCAGHSADGHWSQLRHSATALANFTPSFSNGAREKGGRQVHKHGCVGQEDADPYWSRPWPSAAALAAELLRHPELVAGRRAVEVGAGLGVASIAAALAGAPYLGTNRRLW